MSKYNLYPTLGKKDISDNNNLLMDLLTYLDGKNDLIDISDKIGCPIWNLFPYIDKLLDEKLIIRLNEKI